MMNSKKTTLLIVTGIIFFITLIGTILLFYKNIHNPQSQAATTKYEALKQLFVKTKFESVLFNHVKSNLPDYQTMPVITDPNKPYGYYYVYATYNSNDKINISIENYQVSGEEIKTIINDEYFNYDPLRSKVFYSAQIPKENNITLLGLDENKLVFYNDIEGKGLSGGICGNQWLRDDLRYVDIINPKYLDDPENVQTYVPTEENKNKYKAEEQECIKANQ